jgi:hypothetical protein
VTQLLASCRLQRIPSKILVFGGHLAFLLPTHFRVNDPLESQSGEPSKNELKKRAKAAEKERKAAEKAAKLAEQQREKAAAEEVSHLSPQTVILSMDFPPREKQKTISHESSTVNFLSTSLSPAPGSCDTRLRPSHPSWMGSQSSSVHACTLSVVKVTRCF